MYGYPDRCQHIKVNGVQCGSPALRRNRFCFFHKQYQNERIRLTADRRRRGTATFILPVLEDANSIQMAIMQIMRLILTGEIEHKTASLLLYALQTASRGYVLQTGAIATSGSCQALREDKRVQEAYLGRAAAPAGATR